MAITFFQKLESSQFADPSPVAVLRHAQDYGLTPRCLKSCKLKGVRPRFDNLDHTPALLLLGKTHRLYPEKQLFRI